MTNVKISALPNAVTPLTGAELIPLVQDSITRKATIADVVAPAISDMAALQITPVVDGQLIYLSGYETPVDGGEGQFIGVTGAAPGTYTDNGGTIIVPSGSGGSAWLRVIEGPYNVKWFGAKGDGLTNDAPAIQATFDAIEATTNTIVAYFPTGTYKINTGLTMNQYYCSIDGHATIDASSNATITALTITGDVAIETSNYYARRGTITGNMRFKGPGKSTASTGIYFNSSVVNSNAAAYLDNVAVFSFGKGHYHNDRSHGFTGIRCETFDCGICLYSPVTVTDGGERMNYISCTFYNSDLAVSYANGDGTLNFDSCSFDYNTLQFTITEGRVFLMNCHIEATNYAAPPIVVGSAGGSGGATFEMRGGWFLCTGTVGSSTLLNSIKTTGVTYIGGGIFLRDVFCHNLTSNGYWATGDGNVSIINTVGYNVMLNVPSRIRLDLTLMTDGDFENSTTVNVAPYTTTNISSLTVDTDPSNPAKKSLKVVKTGAAGSAGSQATIVLYAPIFNQSCYGSIRGYIYKASGSGVTGTVGWWAGFGRLQNGGYVTDTYPTLYRRAPAEPSGSINYTAASAGWLEIAPGILPRAPSWATHVYLIVDLSTLSSGTFYLDDFEAYTI